MPLSWSLLGTWLRQWATCTITVTEVVIPVVMKSVFSVFFSIMCVLNTDYSRDGLYSVRSFLCMWPKNENNFMWEGFLSYRFHSRFKENTQKEHAEIKLGKIGAHLEASARKSLAISASIAWIATKICIYIYTRQLWFIDYAVATDCGKNGVNWYRDMVYDGQIDPTLILFWQPSLVSF